MYKIVGKKENGKVFFFFLLKQFDGSDEQIYD